MLLSFQDLQHRCHIARARLDDARQTLVRWQALTGLAAPQGDGASHASSLVPALEALFTGADDVVFRSFSLGATGARATLIYLNGMVKQEELEQYVIGPLMRAGRTPGEPLPPDTAGGKGGQRGQPDLRQLMESLVAMAEVKLVSDLDEAAREVLAGRSLLVVEGQPGAASISNRGFQARPVEKPPIEFALKGPREGFSENLVWNIALVRRRLRDVGLKVERRRLGVRTQTDVALLYLDGVVNPGVVREVRRRLDGITIDGILDSGYVEQLIEDCWWSPFPTVNGSERPDVIVSSLLEGRVAILVDNASFALVVPTTFDSLFHSPEDSYDRWLPVNVLRWVRFLASIIALVTPSLYVALTAFNPGILPPILALKLAASREGVAFPAVLEAVIAQLSLEILKEAGLRIPAPVGQIFGVVGGIVLGSLGVQAGIFSELMVIVVSLTALASFSIPVIPLGTAIRLLGFPLMMLTAFLGLFGLGVGLVVILTHLASLKSFGVPYLAPYLFYDRQDWKDSIVKAPLVMYRRRPSFLAPLDRVMQARAPASHPDGAARGFGRGEAAP